MNDLSKQKELSTVNLEYVKCNVIILKCVVPRVPAGPQGCSCFWGTSGPEWSWVCPGTRTTSLHPAGTAMNNVSYSFVWRTWRIVIIIVSKLCYGLYLSVVIDVVQMCILREAQVEEGLPLGLHSIPVSLETKTKNKVVLLLKSARGSSVCLHSVHRAFVASVYLYRGAAGVFHVYETICFLLQQVDLTLML